MLVLKGYRYLKSKFKWVVCILSGNLIPPTKGTLKEAMREPSVHTGPRPRPARDQGHVCFSFLTGDQMEGAQVWEGQHGGPKSVPTAALGDPGGEANKNTGEGLAGTSPRTRAAPWHTAAHPVLWKRARALSWLCAQPAVPAALPAPPLPSTHGGWQLLLPRGL